MIVFAENKTKSLGFYDVGADFSLSPRFQLQISEIVQDYSVYQSAFCNNDSQYLAILS
jgi:hypothetical protein